MGRKREYETGDPELTTEQAGSFVNLLIKKGGAYCKTCGDRLDGYPIQRYPHDAGWTVKGLEEKQWLYIVCPRCGYQNSLWKLGIPRE